jgi:hypothetical protein
LGKEAFPPRPALSRQQRFLLAGGALGILPVRVEDAIPPSD